MPTPNYGLRYPSGSDEPNGPLQIQHLAEDVEDLLADGLLAWQAYTPVLTGSTSNPSLGNGTATGHYCKIGKTVHFTAKILWGSTTTNGSGFYSVSLPPGLNASSVGTNLARAYFFDSSGATVADKHFVGVGTISASAAEVDRIYLTGASANGLPWSAAAPVVPDDDDYIQVAGTYETAA